MRNHYEILGVSPGASREEIKKVFNDYAKKYAPRVVNEKETDEFKSKLGAYKALMDPDERAKCDANYLAANPPNVDELFAAVADLSLGITKDIIKEKYLSRLSRVRACFIEMYMAWFAICSEVGSTEQALKHEDFLILDCLTDKIFVNGAYTRNQGLVSLGLRPLAWVGMVDVVRSYRQGFVSENLLRSQTAFIAKAIRDGEYFKDFYNHLYAPILAIKKKLEIKQEEKSNDRCITKIEQLDSVLTEVRKILHAGVHELMALHKEQIIKNGTKDNTTLLAKRQEIFQKAADKIREYENKKEIGQARNKIARVLKAILLAIPAVLLALPCVLTKTGRRAWMGLFYYNKTEQALKKARRELLKAKGPSIAA